MKWYEIVLDYTKAIVWILPVIVVPVFAIYIFYEIHAYFIRQLGFSAEGEDFVDLVVSLFIGSLMIGSIIYVANVAIKTRNYIRFIRQNKFDEVPQWELKLERYVFRKAVCPVPFVRKLIWGSE